MGLPEDLKNYRAPDAFQLVDEEFAGALIFAGLFVVVVLERMGIL